MSMPHPNTDPFAPVTRVELHAELADIREALARIGERQERSATKESVLKGVLGMIGVFVALLSVAVGIILKSG